VSNNDVFGVFAFGGDVFVSGSTLVGNQGAGLDASDGGRAQLTFSSRVVDNEGAGVSATNGGVLTLQDGLIIEDNTGSGVSLGGASSLRMRGGVTVRGNSQDGITIADTSVATFGDSTSQIVDNGGWGIFCLSAPSVAMIATGPDGPGNLDGNGAGTENCPNR
jgi:hypothetical protein